MANFKKKIMASFWGKFAFIKTFDLALSKLRRNGDISSQKKLVSSPVSPLLTPSSFTQSVQSSRLLPETLVRPTIHELILMF